MKCTHPISCAIAALALSVGLPAWSMPPGNPPGDATAQIAPTMQGPTQDATNEGADASFKAADREMTRAYAAVLDKYARDTAFIARLRAAQRAWLVFRDAEVAATYPDADPASTYGSVYPMCVSQLKTELTMQRIEQLKHWSDGAEEGDVCSGSVRIHGDTN